MNLYHLSDKKKVSQFASEWVERAINEVGAKSLFIPAGNTPIGLYEIWEKDRPKFLDSVKLLQIDEVISGPKTGMFKRFFEEYLPTYSEQIDWIGEKENAAEIAILGLGVNGHIAFHEPELTSDFSFGRVKLSSITCKNLDAGDNVYGLSYGLGSFLKCKKILMIILGESKQEILERLLNRDPNVPAAKLLDHPGFEIICDQEAYGAYAAAV